MKIYTFPPRVSKFVLSIIEPNKCIKWISYVEYPESSRSELPAPWKVVKFTHASSHSIIPYSKISISVANSILCGVTESHAPNSPFNFSQTHAQRKDTKLTQELCSA